MLVKKATVVPIECVARGYLAGSGWKEYQQTQTVCGVVAAARAAAVRPAPAADLHARRRRKRAATTSTSASTRPRPRIGDELAAGAARPHARRSTPWPPTTRRGRGIIIADTKFEFGLLPDGRLILVDEVLTPDSSRFWPADGYEPGRDQPSFDKQFVRNWLEEPAVGQDPAGPGAAGGRRRGHRVSDTCDASRRLTGKTLEI